MLYISVPVRIFNIFSFKPLTKPPLYVKLCASLKIDVLFCLTCEGDFIMSEKRTIIDSNAFFERFTEEGDTKHPNGGLRFKRLETEIFFGDILEIAKSTSDVTWILEQICGALSICANDWKEDYIREHPEEEYALETFEPYIEVYT